MAGLDKRGIFTGMLTWEQPHCLPFRDLLAPPYIYHHPLIELDGEAVVRPRRED